MNIEGYYYLHQNGQLIHKRALEGVEADFRESDFVQHFWPFDRKDREAAVTLVIEAQALGAESGRARQLMDTWLITEDDCQEWANRNGAMIRQDGNDWCAHRTDFVDLQASPVRFGTTKFDALVALAKDLGFKAGKTWGASFADLLKGKPS